MPRARATETGRGPNLHVVYRRAPSVPRSREREKRPAAGKEKVADVQKKMHLVRIRKVPLRDERLET